MSDVLLIQPPVRDFYLTKKRTIPYGLICIASSLREAGFSVDLLDGLATRKSRVIDLPAEMEYLKAYYPGPDYSPFSLFYQFRHFGYSFQHIAVEAKKSGAFLVGISSLFTPYFQEALEVARIVKKSLPGCKTVLGGHHPTSLPETVLECADVDYILRGEGERSMPLLAKAVQQGFAPDGIPGLSFVSEKGKKVISPPALVEDLSESPRPAIDLIDNRFYSRKGKGSSVITASRGCTMKCSYCSTGKNSYLKYRRRNVDSIMREIDLVVASEAGFIDFEDENLSFNRDWFMELLERLIGRYGDKTLEIRAMNGLLPSTLDEEMIHAMKKAGFKALNLSLCTVSKKRLKQFTRPDVTLSFERVLDWAEKAGLEAVGYIIIGAPGQPAEESLADLIYFADKRVLAGVSVFYPAPGSGDYEVCRQKNLLPPSLLLSRATALPVSDLTNRQEIITLLRLGRILNYMKSLKDQNMDFHDPETDDVGRQLLRLFLEDGRIRGIDDNGRLYDHNVSLSLTGNFLSMLRGIDLKGTGGLHNRKQQGID